MGKAAESMLMRANAEGAGGSSCYASGPDMCQQGQPQNRSSAFIFLSSLDVFGRGGNVERLKLKFFI